MYKKIHFKPITNTENIIFGLFSLIKNSSREFFEKMEPHPNWRYRKKTKSIKKKCLKKIEKIW